MEKAKHSKGQVGDAIPHGPPEPAVIIDDTVSCHVCEMPLRTDRNAGYQALAFCGGCGKPTCAEHRDDSSAALCPDCQAPA